MGDLGSVSFVRCIGFGHSRPSVARGNPRDGGGVHRGVSALPHAGARGVI